MSQPPKQWMLTRDTRLESGEHQIDGTDAEGFPIRICLGVIPGMHAYGNDEPEEGDDQ